jgi:hypothetical protein
VSDPRGIAGLVQALEKPPPALLAVACHNMASQVYCSDSSAFFFRLLETGCHNMAPPALLAVACHNMASQVLFRLQGLFFF